MKCVFDEMKIDEATMVTQSDLNAAQAASVKGAAGERSNVERLEKLLRQLDEIKMLREFIDGESDLESFCAREGGWNMTDLANGLEYAVSASCRFDIIANLLRHTARPVEVSLIGSDVHPSEHAILIMFQGRNTLGMTVGLVNPTARIWIAPGEQVPSDGDGALIHGSEVISNACVIPKKVMHGSIVFKGAPIFIPEGVSLWSVELRVKRWLEAAGITQRGEMRWHDEGFAKIYGLADPRWHLALK